MKDCPKEILVGYETTCVPKTGNRLAYVTYMKDGKIYKQKSFDNWRNKEAGTKTYLNEPQQGFKVLFNVGGCKSGWNVRQTYFRVLDPRGFEFEISSNNFVNILQKETIIQGVLSGKYAYVWEGQNLELIKDDDPVYIEGVKNNTALNNENEKVTKENIVLGQGYRLRDHKNGYYIGRLPWKTYRGEQQLNEFGKELPITEYVLEEQLMYTFVVNEKSLAGYKDMKNVKFKNPDKFISNDEVEKEVAKFYLSCVGKAPETIDWGYEENKTQKLNDSYKKIVNPNPQYYQTYNEWINAPFDKDKFYFENYKYNFNWFVVDTGDTSHFKSVISFKFKDGTIKNYVFEECTFTPEKIIVNKQITPNNVNNKFYYNNINEMNRYIYFAYIHNNIKEFTEVDKLMPCYGMYYTWINYSTFGIYNKKRYKLTINIPKAYYTIKY